MAGRPGVAMPSGVKPSWVLMNEQSVVTTTAIQAPEGRGVQSTA
jgi:hypothetical protein